MRVSALSKGIENLVVTVWFGRELSNLKTLCARGLEPKVGQGLDDPVPYRPHRDHGGKNTGLVALVYMDLSLVVPDACGLC